MSVTIFFGTFVIESKKKISRNKGDFSDGRMAKNDEKSPFLAK